MWGIVPAAGLGTRIQPLAFSKELLPVGSRMDGSVERPRAASEFLLERMALAGVTKVCFVISPGKSDILQYYGANAGSMTLCYVVQPGPAGLCDAIFRALPLIHPAESVVIGLPDTIWFPADALRYLDDRFFSFLLFPVRHPELFDAVVTDERGRVTKIQVKHPRPETGWIWGAFKMPGAVLGDLFRLWCTRGRQDEYIGPLVNEFLADGGEAWGVREGRAYVDVGTLNGYRQAINLLSGQQENKATAREEEPPGSSPDQQKVESSAGLVSENSQSSRGA